MSWSYAVELFGIFAVIGAGSVAATKIEGDPVCFIEDCSGTLIELLQSGGAKGQS